MKIKCPFGKEIEIGRRVEMEHTKNPKIAERIAREHLKEFPCYYSKGVIPMERKLRAIG